MSLWGRIQMVIQVLALNNLTYYWSYLHVVSDLVFIGTVSATALCLKHLKLQLNALTPRLLNIFNNEINSHLNLKATGIGKTVNQFRKLDDGSGEMASTLIRKWKVLASRNQDTDTTPRPPSSSVSREKSLLDSHMDQEDDRDEERTGCEQTSSGQIKNDKIKQKVLHELIIMALYWGVKWLMHKGSMFIFEWQLE